MNSDTITLLEETSYLMKMARDGQHMTSSFQQVKQIMPVLGEGKRDVHAENNQTVVRHILQVLAHEIQLLL